MLLVAETDPKGLFLTLSNIRERWHSDVLVTWMGPGTWLGWGGRRGRVQHLHKGIKGRIWEFLGLELMAFSILLNAALMQVRHRPPTPALHRAGLWGAGEPPCCKP